MFCVCVCHTGGEKRSHVGVISVVFSTKENLRDLDKQRDLFIII